MKKETYAIFAVIVLCILLLLYSFNILSPPLAKADSSTFNLTYTNVTDCSLSLKWSLPENFYKYNVYRANEQDNTFILIGTTFKSSFTDAGLNPLATYRYYIKAFDYYKTQVDSYILDVTTSSPKVVLGFSSKYSTDDNSSYNSLANNHTLIDQIATYTYTTDSYGNLSGNEPLKEILFANENGIKPFALVTNNFSAPTAHSVLESPSSRQNLINNIIAKLRANNYAGVNMDFEGIYNYDRDNYTAFISELCSTLHPEGFLISVDLPAKTYDNPNEKWSGGYDYAKIAALTDQVIIMAYDEHYLKGPAGPIASIGWVENVVKYALTVIPKEKILLGTAAYGYDWSSKGPKAYSISQAFNTASSYGSSIEWDSISQSPYFIYYLSGVKHTVWFENQQSLNFKLDIVNNKGLAGIAIWKLGLENPNYWTSIKSKLRK